MERRKSLYVSRKNPLTWLMALCLCASAVLRIVFACLQLPGYTTPWTQIVLPVAGTILFVLIVLLCGQTLFYKSALGVWMISLYYCFSITNYGFSNMVEVLYWVAIFFFALSYTELTAGKRSHVWLLLPLFACPLSALLYLHKEALLAKDWSAAAVMLPDILLIFGWMVMVFAIRLYPVGQYHPTWGDRPDGRRVRTLPPMSQVSPYIMVTRNASTNYFADSIEITHVERYIRQKRKEGLTSFGIMHVLLAAYIRTIAKYPALNRFLAGQKVYSRGNDLQFCLTVKKEMSVDSPDTVIKVHLDPHDTAEDVYNKINAEIDKVKNSPLDSAFDNTAQLLTLIPGVFLKFTVWLLKTLDYFGLLPSFLLEVSPFHGSVFFTSMGSLGIPPIYHHLYDFGNLPVFGAFGCKRRSLEVLEDGTVVQRKYVDIKFTLDERIADGYYYAAFFKQYKRTIMHPEVLDVPPEEVLKDID